MTLRWTRASLRDLQRVHDVLHPVNPDAAARLIQRLTDGPDLLLNQPRIGTRLPEFEPREVRCLFIGDYEMRYEITADQVVWILRAWHTREFR
ncbi:MAG: type II toxin-antitoxin system RelE/ParE family toxin [Methyloversatilis sp.]|uniref:type II toxin-antitoxin system RelE/ParE family toxin n=1 Tax=Methyloversatilis sp. TaxID=2569862 RepID=UPI0027351F38|nr:type II toxin-antitoxin system RelE/ParE family toxin [Methyloversatilis sp.]MDP3874421.1 type II toxin-antitoxin system RelE/ParE family toxin [Methyloversatilis sp.]